MGLFYVLSGRFDGRRRSEQPATWRWDHVGASVMTLYSVSSPLDAEGKEMRPLLRGGSLRLESSQPELIISLCYRVYTSPISQD